MKCCAVLKSYLNQHKIKTKKDLVEEIYQIPVSRQKNASDCGFLACYHMRNIFKDPSGWLKDNKGIRTQINMSTVELRLWIAKDIMDLQFRN